MKTAELEGALLDYWAAKIDRGDVESNKDFKYWKRELWDCGKQRYSSDWAQGGPLIDQERIDLQCFAEGRWFAQAMALEPDNAEGYFGATPLIASMRAYVASKFGDEVPEE